MGNMSENSETGFFKNSKIILAGVLIMLVILAGSVSILTNAGEKESYSVQGSLKFEEVDLNSKIPGNIESILVEEGDEVKAGDPLIVIDSASIEAKKLQAEGALAAARATYEKAQNGARSQEVIQAKAAAELYEKTFNRVRELYEQGAVSENSYDQAHTQYIAAQETYSMALEGARSEDVLAAKALVLQAEGAVAEVESYLEDCVIRAPMDGVATDITVSAGELISTGTPLATVAGKTAPWVDVNVMENYLSYVSVGDSVDVTFAAYPDRIIKGTVAEVSQKPDFAAKRATNNNDDFDVMSYGVKVALNDVDFDLYPGMTVMVDFGNKAGN